MNSERIEFTKEMKETHTILAPMMLPTHFSMLESVFNNHGFKVEILNTTGRQIVDEGLKSVHNDTCYPALLVIGQLIDALKSGKYDTSKTTLLISQTGGGCRASNYIYLLRKALKQSGFEHVPVVSLNFSRLEKNSGFKFNLKMITEMLYSVIYGDLIMWVANQCRPYEKNKGDTQKVVDKWTNKLSKELTGFGYLAVKKNYKNILEDFSGIGRDSTPKIKVGIVGEIYMKYAPLGNNNLEDFLIAEGAEPVLSGVLDFCLYCIKNNLTDYELYGKSSMNKQVAKIGLKIFQHWQDKMIKAVKNHGVFRAPTSFKSLEKVVDGFIGLGAKMGEGWLLTSEMLELIDSGINNIVCTQPFGCLPNHIVAKGMMRKIKDSFPMANIVPVDYDPSATAINQENRLKLMLSNAKLTAQFSGKQTFFEMEKDIDDIDIEINKHEDEQKQVQNA
ncbi:MAG: 2-hydroxyglutaryl-CoA dehydratase [Oscillospiraceae bacterium]|jgi:predicted nucleotide-binding protein (sugar kinase/HSP70/actin superfamily)|nr:2-hydroxyglutaryl-CoA dehydratase [Oscillospiraceae bacterium]